MLGGGSFTVQDKVFPGTYINFVSTASGKASMSGRGAAAIPMLLDWGPEKTVFEVTAEEFQKNSRKIFGYGVDEEAMLPVRELFKNMSKGFFFRLNGGNRSANDYGTARYSGSQGNSISIIISKNVDDAQKYDVKTLVAGREMDCQTVSKAGELKDNDWVVFKKEAALEETAGLAFTGGSSAQAVTGEDYADFLEKIEQSSFQILCCPSSEEQVKALFAAFTKRMREEAGVKFQTVMHQYAKADYEGVISVENETEESQTGLVYWVAGAEAACAVNSTIENKIYDGEYSVKTPHTQAQLSDGIKAGKLLFHKVGAQIRVLTDQNTLITVTSEKGEDFSNNQTIRVLDQIGNDIASLFHTRYLGKIPNDRGGRVSLWNDIVTYGKQLTGLRAIEAVNSDEITVEQGESKKSVVVSFPVKPINCMSILYMTVLVS